MSEPARRAAQAAKDAQAAPDTPPPVMGSWRNLYIALLGELAALVALFYALTRWAA